MQSSVRGSVGRVTWHQSAGAPTRCPRRHSCRTPHCTWHADSRAHSECTWIFQPATRHHLSPPLFSRQIWVTLLTTHSETDPSVECITFWASCPSLSEKSLIMKCSTNLWLLLGMQTTATERNLKLWPQPVKSPSGLLSSFLHSLLHSGRKQHCSLDARSPPSKRQDSNCY